MNTEHKYIVFAALLLGVALVVGLWVHGSAMGARGQNDIISVTGSAKEKVVADLGKWVASFSLRSNLSNTKEVLDHAAANTAKIKAFVKGLGFEDANITVLPVQTNPMYDNSKGYYGGASEVVGYNVTQEIRIENNDLEKIDKLANAVRNLAGQGIVFDNQRTEYYYTKLAELRPQLFAAATKDAQSRAEAIAAGTGVKVGALRSARTGVVQVMAPNSIDVSDYGTYDLSTKDKEISATVSVSFALVK